MNTLASRCQATCVTATFDPRTHILAGVLRDGRWQMSVSIVSSTNAVIVSRDRLFNHLITARNLAMQPYSTLLIDGLHPLNVDPSRCRFIIYGAGFNFSH